jgi:hypothetical protein
MLAMRWFWRLGIITLVAIASFILAIGRFSAAAEKSCAQRVARDPSLQVAWNEQPRTDLSLYRIRVTREGQPITDARVCLNTYMLGMSAMAATDIGREVEPGTYELRLNFEMGDAWAGQVIVAEKGKPLAALPLTLEVIDTWGRSVAS